jgi:Uma2 family endonuclease
VAKPKLRLTADYIWETPDDGNRYEVIDGKLFVTPPPTWGHQFGLGNLYGIVWSFVHPRQLGFIVFAPTGVVLDPETGVEPDLLYISKQRSEIIVERGVEGAPDLVVESLSPSTQRRDRGIKMRKYAESGVPHYWILDSRPRTLEAYRLKDDGYELIGVYKSGDIFRPELFSGLEISIDGLWT